MNIVRCPWVPQGGGGWKPKTSKARGMKMQDMKMQDMNIQDINMQYKNTGYDNRWHETIFAFLLWIKLPGASSQRCNLV